MDGQHGILLDTVNDLREVLVHGAGRERVCQELNRLREFTHLHFSSEEQLLELHNYPDLEEHHKVHKRLLRQLQDVLQRAEHGEEIDIRALLDFLRHWYVQHIEEVDRRYGEWLNRRGIF